MPFANRWQVIEERQAGVATKQYVWSAFYVDQLVERDDHDPATTGSALNRRLSAQQDADYNVTSLTDASGAVVERYAYDPYGAVTVENDDGSTRGTGLASASSYNWTMLRQGTRLDVVTNTYDNQRRVYIVSLGRFGQEDPAGYRDSNNRYAAERDSPLRWTDYSGLAVIGPNAGYGPVVPYDPDAFGINQYHYGYSKFLGTDGGLGTYADGLRTDSYATPMMYETGGEAQQYLALPTRTSPPDIRLTVCPEAGRPVQYTSSEWPVDGQPGGAPAFYFPDGTGPGTITNPVPLELPISITTPAVDMPLLPYYPADPPMIIPEVPELPTVQYPEGLDLPLKVPIPIVPEGDPNGAQLNSGFLGTLPFFCYAFKVGWDTGDIHEHATDKSLWNAFKVSLENLWETESNKPFIGIGIPNPDYHPPKNEV